MFRDFVINLLKEVLHIVQTEKTEEILAPETIIPDGSLSVSFDSKVKVKKTLEEKLDSNDFYELKNTRDVFEVKSIFYSAKGIMMYKIYSVANNKSYVMSKDVFKLVFQLKKNVNVDFNKYKQGTAK